MKQLNKFSILLASLLAVALSGCGNQFIPLPSMNNSSTSPEDAYLQYLDFYPTVDNTYYVGQGRATLLSNIVIPSTYKGMPVTGIIEDGFDHARIETITIPDSIKTIGMNAFNCCQSLKSVSIPDSVTSIEINAFNYCTSLADVTIGRGITTLTTQIFIYCASLTSIIIPDTVYTIETWVFGGCVGLSSITIGRGVDFIGPRAFGDCSRLNSIKYNGTIYEWNMVEKGHEWNYKVPATVVHCSNGDVNI